MGTRIKASLAVLFALYLAFLLYLTLFGRTTSYATVAECFRERGNLIPLHTLIRQTSALINGHYSARLYVMNVAGNIAAFAPFGFFLPALFPKCRRFLPFFLILSLSIVAVEVCQLILRVGSLDVDDYILNSAGAVAVFFILKTKPGRAATSKIYRDTKSTDKEAK